MTRLAARSAAVRSALAGSLFLAAWLLLAAMPCLADGGPHVASVNSGNSSLTADSCAGCHRVHTAQGAMLLRTDEEELCLSCHGAATTGATTDVETGVQYAVTAGGLRDTTAAGALRSGGFVEARIGSDDITRISYPRLQGGAIATWFSSEVPVLADPLPATSAHLHVGTSGVTAQNVAWGNGALNSGAGPTVTIGCASCHNPHGNGMYRILNAVPSATGTGFVAVSPGVTVTDAALPTGAGAAAVRNYTVQWGRTLADVVDGTYTGGTADPLAGDYWRRYLPWDGVPGWNGTSITPASGLSGDRPMYVPGGSNLTSFRAQITLWCSACHTRYDQITGAQTDTGDTTFRYRHDIGQTECTQCHVAHGSNAAMPGTYSATYPYPDDDPAGVRDISDSSRLLKVDNRGTCQQCHDPTHTIPFTNVVTP